MSNLEEEIEKMVYSIVQKKKKISWEKKKTNLKVLSSFIFYTLSFFLSRRRF